MPNDNQNPIEHENLLAAITRHVFLVMLHISWPKMSYQIADAIVEIKVDGKDGKEDTTKEVDAEFRTKPQWQLMPEDWRKKLVNLEGRARSLLTNASVQFAAKGMSVLPVSRAQEIFSGLRTLRTELKQYRDEFVQEYESILENLKERLDSDLYKKVEGRLPTKESVAAKFNIIWAIIPAGGKSAVTDTELEILDAVVSRSVVDGPELDEAMQVLQGLRARLEHESRTITDDEAADLIDEAQQQMHQFTQDMLEDMSRGPRQVLVDAADNLLEALRNPSRMIRNGTINQVRDAFELIQGFEFLQGPELLANIRECRERLDDVTPRDLNSNAEIGAALAAGIQGVRDEAADVQAAATAVRQFRGIKLRERPPRTESNRQPAAV